MNTVWTRLAVLSFALLLTACASIQSSRAPNARLDVKDIKTAYVQKIEGDGYNIYQTITDRLNQLDIKATNGSAEFPPQRTDIIVTYVDRWMWDITMYMLRLTVQIRDGTSRAILSSAESYRPSLERRSQEEMVAETLDAAFNAK